MLNLKKELETKLTTFLDSNEAQTLIKGIKEEKEYMVKFKITNESQDRDGEVIKSGGIDWSHFDKNPVILINHSYKVESIAGKCIKREIIGNETYMTVQLAKDVEAGELVRKLHLQGMIKGVSIGFIPKERDSQDSKIITKSEALEASFVPIGSNREALIEDEETMKSMKKCGFACKKEANKITLEVGQNVSFRNIYKTTNDKGEEVERIFPLESELPRLGKIIAIYDNQDLLKWNELVSGTKENPYLVIQSFVKSKKGPVLLTTNVDTYEYELLKIEKVIEQKSIEDGEVKFSNVEQEEKIDTSKVFDNIKTISDDVNFIKSQIKTFFDDKKKETKVAQIRDLGKELQKSLSAFNQEVKSQK